MFNFSSFHQHVSYSNKRQTYCKHMDDYCSILINFLQTILEKNSASDVFDKSHKLQIPMWVKEEIETCENLRSGVRFWSWEGKGCANSKHVRFTSKMVKDMACLLNSANSHEQIHLLGMCPI